MDRRVLDEARRAPQKDREHARRHGVKRPAVADLLLPIDTPQTRYHVEGRHPRRFQYIQYAVHQRYFSATVMNFFSASAKSPSMVHPAAFQ